MLLHQLRVRRRRDGQTLSCGTPGRRSGIRYKPLMLLALEISCESSKVAVVIYKQLLVGLDRDWFVEV